MRNAFVFAFLVFAGFLAFVAGARVYSQVGSDLSSGTFNNTLFNASGLFVHLNWTDASNSSFVLNGTFVSPVFDATTAARWTQFFWAAKPKTCPGNMSFIDKLNGYCIDSYEASMPSANSTVMGNSTDTANPDSATGKYAVSQPGVVPWVSVSANTARTACLNANKFLCTSDEWLGAADLNGVFYNLPALLSAAPYYCVVDSGTYCSGHSWQGGHACNTGSKTGCVSKYGVYDMTGNVYEWTNETVTTIKSCLPTGTAGYCYASDSGWKNATDSSTLKYGNDGVYFAAGTSTGRAVFRGGFWGTTASAGPFSASLHVAPPDTGSHIGFRCCSVPT